MITTPRWSSTTYTVGTVIEEYYLGKEDSIISTFAQDELSINRGEVLLITATSTANSNVIVSITWVEDL